MDKIFMIKIELVFWKWIRSKQQTSWKSSYLYCKKFYYCQSLGINDYKTVYVNNKNIIHKYTITIIWEKKKKENPIIYDIRFCSTFNNVKGLIKK